MSMKQVLRIRHVLAALLLLGGGLVVSCSREKEAPLPTVKVEKGTLEVAIEEIGMVESQKVWNIKAPHEARIVSIIPDGTIVKKDDVVAVLNTEDLSKDLEKRIDELKNIKKDLEANVEELKIALRSNSLDISSAEAQLDMARVRLASVNRDLAETEFLRDKELVPADDVRSAVSEANSSKINTLSQDMSFRGQMTEAQSSEKSKGLKLERLGMSGHDARKRIDEVQERIDQSQIKAPVDGLFLRAKRWSWQTRRTSERQVGEEVREGEQLGEIPDLNAIVVRSQIPERHLLSVKPGTEVTLTFDSLDGLQVPGKVTYVAPVAIERETSAGGQASAGGEQLSGEKVFEILVQPTQQNPRMKPGIAGRGRFVLSRQESLIKVPIAAVSTENGKHFVHVETAAGLERREVTLGGKSRDEAEVLTGLREGEMVVKDAYAAEVLHKS